MKIVVNTDALKVAIVKASGTIEKEDSMTPILSNFLLRIKEGKAILIGTNLELGFIGTITGAAVEQEGEITLPADKLVAIAPQLDSSEVTFESNEHACTISCGDAQWFIHGMEPTQYPEVPDFTPEEAITVDRLALFTALNRVSYAICEDQTRTNLMQVCIKDGMMCSSDGHRLSFVKFAWDQDELTIPAPAVPELTKILKFSQADTVQIARSESLILFKVDDNVFSTRVSVGAFPEVVERVLKPSDRNDKNITVSRQALVKAIRKVKITSSEENLVTLTAEPNKVIIKAKDSIGNLCTAVLGAVWEGAEELTINLNWQYLLDVLNVIAEDDVVLRCAIPEGNRLPPVRIDSLNGGHVNILMQLRAN